MLNWLVQYPARSAVQSLKGFYLLIPKALDAATPWEGVLLILWTFFCQSVVGTPLEWNYTMGSWVLHTYQFLLGIVPLPRPPSPSPRLAHPSDRVVLGMEPQIWSNPDLNNRCYSSIQCVLSRLFWFVIHGRFAYYLQNSKQISHLSKIKTTETIRIGWNCSADCKPLALFLKPLCSSNFKTVLHVYWYDVWVKGALRTVCDTGFSFPLLCTCYRYREQ